MAATSVHYTAIDQANRAASSSSGPYGLGSVAEFRRPRMAHSSAPGQQGGGGDRGGHGNLADGSGGKVYWKGKYVDQSQVYQVEEPKFIA